MTRNKAALGIDGVFASTSLKSGEDWRWQTHLANLPIYQEFLDNSTDLSGDATKEIDFAYSEAYKRIFDLYINNSTVDKTLLGSKQVADSMAEFALGRCVMVQNGNWAWSQIAEVTGNTVKEENVRYLPIYMGLPNEENQGICIGTENYICVNKNVSPEKQEMALDFLEWLYTSETGKDYVTNRFHFITPFTSFESDEVPSDPLAKETVRYLNSGLTNVPWIFTVFPSVTFKNDFGAALLQYAQGTKSWSEVTTLVKNRWQEESMR
jgi:raffinose/stachyose/melibiose transport system substrate-binding protein